MRPHGRASIDSRSPRALAVCDRCYFLFNLDELRWQHQWIGPKLQNLRKLVCRSCLDKPQEQLRTILIPADPVAVQNPRVENYVSDNNPLSGIGASPNWLLQQYGSFIGNLTGGGGVAAAFDSNSNKPAWMCANNTRSNSSFNNYIGINWAGNVSNLNMPSSMKPPVIRHSLLSFTAYAPNDRGFLGSEPTDYVVQASPVDAPIYGAWTTISSGTTTGESGEIITGECAGPEYQFHRLAFEGDQLNYVAVAHVEFNVAQTGATGDSS